MKQNYKKGFEILMEYFDSISDEEKEEVDKRLKEVGL
jgi:predicted CopG family antitoxin